MMLPESSSPNQVAQQAEVVGQPSTMVKVAVPTGATPGQQINFTLPNGQRVTTSVQEGVQPGSVLTVAVPNPGGVPQGSDAPAPASSPPPAAPANSVNISDGLAPAREALLPQTVVNGPEADQRSAGVKWAIYGLSFAVCCFCSPLVGLCIWSALALDYFCKPSQERLRRPHSYGPACASLVTVIVLGVLCLCIFLIFVAAGVYVAAMCATEGPKPEACTDLQKFLNNSDISWGHHHHHGHWHPHHWHNKRMFLDQVLHRHHHEAEGPHFPPGVPSVEDIAMKMDFDAPELGLGPQLGVTGEGPAGKQDAFVF